MDPAVVADRIFPVLGDLGYADVAPEVLDQMAAGPALDPAVGPHVRATVGRWIGTGDPEPAGCGIALLLDESSDAAQAAADGLAEIAEEVDVGGQPCYRYGDDVGTRYLTLCTPGMLLYLVGHDDGRLAEVAALLFEGWRAAGT
ncbi:MAG: hypothetical protein M3527_09755, partial [Actinomycetota bacterium]|nr:hypothetical protein [Actinomycetota bacterium]